MDQNVRLVCVMYAIYYFACNTLDFCRNAIVFLTLYLQLLGMNDAAASALMALFLGGSALGGLLGGWLGDKAAQASAQPEVVSLLPLCVSIAIVALA